MNRSLTGLAALAPLIALGAIGSEPIRTEQDVPAIPAPLQLVAPGTICTDGGEAFPALAADGSELFYATHQRGWTNFRLQISRRSGEGWGVPAQLPFSEAHNDRAPFPSPDGSRLYFSSDRPLPDSPGRRRRRDFNLWFVERTGTGGWSEPEPVPGVNSPADDFHPAVTRDGILYFSSNRSGGHGTYDLYRAAPDESGYATAENLGPQINTAGEETDVYASPDETFLIVVATNRAGGVGGDDLWITIREGEGWGALQNLGSPVNSEVFEYGPFVSPDRQDLYFTTHRRGLGDVVRIPVDAVPLLADLLGKAR
jgi:hypothetical protein